GDADMAERLGLSGCPVQSGDPLTQLRYPAGSGARLPPAVNDALAGETQPAADERFVGTDQAAAQPAAQRTVEPVQQFPAAALEDCSAQLARGRIGVLVEFLKFVENLGDIFDVTLPGVSISSEPA